MQLSIFNHDPKRTRFAARQILIAKLYNRQRDLKLQLIYQHQTNESHLYYHKSHTKRVYHRNDSMSEWQSQR